MANKRMFSLSVIDTDFFLDMPVTAQALYFHLGMRADDDGFIANPKKIIRMVGFNEGDIKILFEKRFVIPFESGVCVIRHWKVNNYLRSDRHTSTIYTEEKAQLSLADNGVYNLGIPTGVPTGIPNAKELATQYSIEEVSIEESNSDYSAVDSMIDYFNTVTGQKRRYSKASRDPISARIKDGYTEGDCKAVISKMYKMWKDDPKMAKYITIETLFRPSNFEKYLSMPDKSSIGNDKQDYYDKKAAEFYKNQLQEA
ncbi:MAG: hypothetical protein B6229_09340 [Spirochaetaceae bacterium 4572_7]|nr:MAG: hypothetical protein B6229_09340 [Spirochaetaceae bacterium 4572_7]